MKTALDWIDYYNQPDFESQVYKGNDLGVSCHVGNTVIKLWSPVASSVTVNFYRDGAAESKPYWRQPLHLTSQGVWQYSIPESLHKTYYDFTLIIDDQAIQSTDPYAKACGVNGYRSMAVDLEATNPTGWHQDCAPPKTNETIIDEIHVKDFSYQKDAGFSTDYRGKYLALTEFDTKLKNSHLSTGLSYLKEVGITHIQLMPIYDFATVDEKQPRQFNWGYDPVNYNVPEGSYSLDPFSGEVRIKELKQAIMSLHRLGFRVIMDVVYNHTYDLDNALQKTMPYYFYRLNKDGSLANGSGCGNDIASERLGVAHYIENSLMYWAKEYHLDGFRFDLMGLLPVDLINRIQDKLDARFGKGEKLLYGEPWAAGSTAISGDIKLANKDNAKLLNRNVGIFSDDTRDIIKGSAGDKSSRGFVNGGDGLEAKVIEAMRGWSSDDYKIVNAPSQIISYISAHDNQTLWDKLAATTSDETLRLKQYKLAVVMYLLAQGRPFMLSGESFCRSKRGDDNSHKSPIAINQINWRQRVDYQAMADYYAGLIGLRQQLIALYDKSDQASQRLYNHWVRPGVVGYMLDNTGGESPYKNLIIIFNRQNEPANCELELGDWQILASETNTKSWQDQPKTVCSQITVNPIGWVLLGQE